MPSQPQHRYLELPDVQRFLQRIGELAEHPSPIVRTLFDAAAPLVVTRAPGRLDLMGGIADYSGSLVLQLPIREATLAAIQPAPDRTVTVVSLSGDRDAEAGIFTMDLAEFAPAGEPIPYETARAWFATRPESAWAAYVVGAFLVLMRERGLRFEQGARIYLHSDVPEGKGVSSSAALEVASMVAITATFGGEQVKDGEAGVELEPREMALLCQMVENLVVGAPCGVMDQMASVCGEANGLMALLCQPAELRGTVHIPEELAVWGIDSNIRHAVSGADYGSVRVGAFMGYRMLLEMVGVVEPGIAPAAISDAHWRGFLANVTPSEFAQEYAHRLPESLRGAEFLEKYGGTTDTVTAVEPERIYAVRQPTAHPIYENFRVRTFARLLAGEPLQNAELLGECMYQSHASYSACGLGSAGTDELVRLARAAGAEQGIYGAKITGGGSGGTVAVLGRHDAEHAVLWIAEEYAKITGQTPYIFQGSSPGAAAFGHLRLAAG